MAKTETPAPEPGAPELEAERMEGPVESTEDAPALNVEDLVKQTVAAAIAEAIPQIIKGVAAAQAPAAAPPAAEPAAEPEAPARPHGDWEGDKLLIAPAHLPDAAAGALYTARLEANIEGATFRAGTLFDNVKIKADGSISGQVGANPGPRHFEVLATSGEQKRWASFRIHAR